MTVPRDSTGTRSDGSGTLHVKLALLGALGAVKDEPQVRTIEFHPGDSPYPVSGFRIDGRATTSLAVASDVHQIEFDVRVNRAAPVEGEFLSYLGTSWGLVRAESLAVPFNYTFAAGSRPVWDARVTFASMPTGWKSATAWGRDGANPNRWSLAAGEALPRGFVALGPLKEASSVVGGREFRVVSLSDPLSYAGSLVPYLDASTPYLRTVYGDVPGPYVLAVSAPDPMLRGGLGAPDSFYVHDESDLRTAAHEWTHAWQRYGGRDEAGDSSAWLSEGAAEWHGTLSLFAAGVWSLESTNGFFARAYENRTREPLKSTPLTRAEFGHDLVAYTKGAIVVSALDDAIVFNTKGRIGLPDFLQALNARAKSGTDRDVRVSNADARETLNRLTGLNFGPFFDDYVSGTEWPRGWGPPEPRARLVVVNATTDPPLPISGRNVTIRAQVDNRGYAAGAADLTLFLDGRSMGARRIEASIGRSATATWAIAAPVDGLHDVKIANFTTTFRVASPARLAATGVQTIPATPSALVPATVLVSLRNSGDFPTEGTVVLFVDGISAGDRNVTVGANSTTIVSFDTTFTDEGARRIAIRTHSDGRSTLFNATLTVGPRDRDGDGVPDARDAYPENSAISEKGFLNDARNLVPVSGLLTVTAAAAAAVGLARRL